MSSRRDAPLARLAGWAARLLAAAILGLGARAAPAAVVEGEPFPALAEFALEGEAVPATAGRVVLVDFWASWCAPCKESFPALDALHREFASQGLLIVAVSVDERKTAYEAFVRRMKPSFLTVRDAAQALVARVSVPTMPTSYVIDRRGVVRHVHVGFHGQKSADALRAQILSLLAESS